MAEIGALLQDVFRVQEGELNEREQVSLISKIEGALATSNTRSRQRVAESLKARKRGARRLAAFGRRSIRMLLCNRIP